MVSFEGVEPDDVGLTRETGVVPPYAEAEEVEPLDETTGLGKVDEGDIVRLEDTIGVKEYKIGPASVLRDTEEATLGETIDGSGERFVVTMMLKGVVEILADVEADVLVGPALEMVGVDTKLEEVEVA